VANQIVAAVFIVLMSLFATTLTMFFMGEVVDRFVEATNKIDIDYGDARFTHQASAVNNIFKWIFSIPVFLTYVWIVWMFKVAIFDHNYTKEDQQFEY
jgi:uncharacterized protein YqhQ